MKKKKKAHASHKRNVRRVQPTRTHPDPTPNELRGSEKSPGAAPVQYPEGETSAEQRKIDEMEQPEGHISRSSR